MNSLFSAVSGQFSRYLVFGTMLPVILFEFLTSIFLFPLLPAGLPVVSRLTTLDKEWLAVVVGVLTLVLAGLLFNVNIPLIRWYEGYPWINSWLGVWRQKRNRDRLNKLSALRTHYRNTTRALNKFPNKSHLSSRLESRRTGIAQEVVERYPAEDRVLPTRLGNVIRSFEYHSEEQYGLDAIYLWSRIVGVVPKEYLSSVDEAKTSFDFFLNCSFVGAVEGVLLLACGLAFKKPFASDQQLAVWIAEMLLMAFLAYFSYLGSIDRASNWGAQVEGVFDLYRWDLLKKLGYTQRPATRQAEKLLWGEISKQVHFGDPPKRPPYAYAGRFTVVPEPADAGLEIASGIKVAKDEIGVELVCTIRNRDSDSRDVESMDVWVWPPEGHEYLWGSATVAGDGVSRADDVLKDYNFRLGRLKHNGVVTLKCKLASVSEPPPAAAAAAGANP